ncbi:hypothetical protein H257_03936 [Aphanomyces astaci]|uniref:Uncharacterized protein n=1 Tax=Aphanomyces astaci TaxID=112090 RepID=W4H0R8_APHAT|nr:hypothetical protein H257_03936 [Aphanomyces astaci]ETV84869.1 hypothetical protein H257_03936 [Aphanomyces astaci]|eukprot:XP_009826561.1 hypothetical protein H257_03936 [Aphanomyces astaci]
MLSMDTLHNVDTIGLAAIDLTSNLFVMDAPVPAPSSPAYVRSLAFGSLSPAVAIPLCRNTRLSTYQHNGALYVEAITRNTDMDELIVLIWTDGGEFDVGLRRFLTTSPEGRGYLDSMSQRPFLSTEDEVTYLASFNVTTWLTQYQNSKQHGIQEYAWIQPTLGGVHKLAVMVLPFQPRQAFWTTVNLCCGFYYDLWCAKCVNGSLIRTDPQFWWQASR